MYITKDKLYIYYGIYFAALTVFFRESSYNVVESNGSVQLELVLSSSSSSDITVSIISIDDSASGE